MDLNNKVIEVLNEKHGKEVMKFFRDNGIDTTPYVGSCARDKNPDDHDQRYYGVCHGERFRCYSLNEVKKCHFEVIKLPSETFENGEEVEVGNCINWYKRFFIGINPKENNYPFVTADNDGMVEVWQECRKIKPFQEEIDAFIAKAKEKGIELVINQII
jgi:hypothetical protein